MAHETTPAPAAADTVRVKVTLPASLVARLEIIAESRGIGLSTLMRMLLYASLDRG